MKLVVSYLPESLLAKVLPNAIERSVSRLSPSGDAGLARNSFWRDCSCCLQLFGNKPTKPMDQVELILMITSFSVCIVGHISVWITFNFYVTLYTTLVIFFKMLMWHGNPYLHFHCILLIIFSSLRYLLLASMIKLQHLMTAGVELTAPQLLSSALSPVYK